MFVILALKQKEQAKEIGSSLEANLVISLNKNLKEFTKDIDLSELCITSAVEIIESTNNDTTVQTKKAVGEKCAVCWKIIKNGCLRHKN